MRKTDLRFPFQSWALRRLITSFLIAALCTKLLAITPVMAADASYPPGYQYICGENNGRYYVAMCDRNSSSAHWVDTVQDAGADYCSAYWPSGQVWAYKTIVSCHYDSSFMRSDGLIWVNVVYHAKGCGTFGGDCNSEFDSFDGFVSGGRYNPALYFVKADLPANSQPNFCCENKVADPIDPVSTAALNVIDDVQQGLPVHRFYNSQDATGSDVGIAWHHTYERKIAIKYSSLTTQLYSTSTTSSSSYTDAASACTSGFAELQSKVSSWSGASALYADGNCQLTKNGVSIGSAPIYYTRQTLAQAASPVAYDVIRDDGQLIRFTVNNGVITAPPGVSLQLAQTASGFTVTDVNNNVEQYDTSGRLLSVTSHAGVVQTMSYDASGRLSGVVDSFGHQLTLSYDAQGHLVTVARQ